MTHAKIVSVTIGPMPQSLGDPKPKVNAYFDDGTDAVLFDYYSDELTFTESDFIGLTQAEGKALFHTKDVAYLQS